MKLKKESEKKEKRQKLEQIIKRQPKSNKISLNEIYVLPQMRKEEGLDKESIEMLADNIEIVGLINDVVLNKKTGNKRYVLIAGERRLRAYKELKKRHGRYFSSIPSKVFHNLDQRQHDALQCSENSYSPVATAEAAEHYAKVYESMLAKYKEEGKEKVFTKTYYAKVMGRSESFIFDCLKFFELPDDIRKLVKEKKLRYGAALQLARLKEDKVRSLYTQDAVYRDYDEKEARDVINRVIRSQQSDIFGKQALDMKIQKQNVLVEIGKKVHQEALASVNYFTKLLQLEKDFYNKNGKIHPAKIQSVKDRINDLAKVFGELDKYYKSKKAGDTPYDGPSFKTVWENETKV